jgi:hypothetical protein
MKTIKTYLPQFAGFYGSLFGAVIEDQEERILEDENLTSDEVDFDYSQVRTAITKECVGVFEDAFNRDMGTDLKVTFDYIYSPKFYNFENDSINVSIQFSSGDFERIKNTLIANALEVAKELKERYSTRPGFISFTSTDFTDWMEDLQKEHENEEEDSHKWGAILDILCDLLQIVNEEEMVDRVQGNVSLDYTIK